MTSTPPSQLDLTTSPTHEGHAPPTGSAEIELPLQRFLEPLIRLAGAQAAVVRVLGAQGDRLSIVASLGLPATVLEMERSVASDCGACGAALAHHKPASDDDLQHCARRTRDAYFGQSSRRILAVPLTHRGRATGVATFFFADLRAIDADVSALIEGLGSLIGLALADEANHRESLEAAFADQRKAMAADVHDSLAQTLSFVKMRMPLLQDAIGSGDAGTALRYCEDVRKAVGSAHTNLRQLLTEFRVPVAPQGLKRALRSSILMFSQRTRVPLEFDDQAPDVSLSAIQESQVFHIVQEALTNIAKHASARHAWLRLRLAGGRLEVTVDDDGCGAPDEDDLGGAHHFGLDIMRERAARLGGRLDIGPREGGGMRVQLSFPVAAGAAASK